MDVSPECLCRAVTWGSWSQCFGVISLERGLGKGKGTTHSCVMKRAQVGSCPQDLSSVQVSGFNPSYWMALGSSSWVLYFCSWKQSSEASGTLCGLSTGSYTEARISDEINGNPWFGLGQQFIRKQKRVVENSCSSWSATVTFFQLQRKACYQKNKEDITRKLLHLRAAPAFWAGSQHLDSVSLLAVLVAVLSHVSSERQAQVCSWKPVACSCSWLPLQIGAAGSGNALRTAAGY